jgi:hypothetical protein
MQIYRNRPRLGAGCPKSKSRYVGLSQSLLGATTFVKTLRSPHALLMHGGRACILRI